ncbi:zinc finger protein 275 isoform X4 [Wyeomyia smithii]|uniref:zinc finger protein 275 isoform X4 n=1 Tax=Wyeomyia smithii TaxID=174621 RepID=UPI002467FFB8|nr:zinc finger protein 275 isoform X4 [Wyeomyia smithii]
MPRRCVVTGCTTNRDYYEPGIRFFQFPRDDERMRELWKRVIGRDENWKIPKLASVCQRHFLSSEITSDRRLPDSVVPTLNLPSKSPECPLVHQLVETKSPTLKHFVNDVDIGKTEYLSVEQDPNKSLLGTTLIEKIHEINSRELLHCRFCASEIEETLSLSITYLRAAEPVRQSIWDICLKHCDNDSIDENLSKICIDCWQRIQEFEKFVENSLHQQTYIIELYRDKLSIVESCCIKEESPESEHEFEQVIIPEQHSNEAGNKSEDDQLPVLIGLSVDEMIAVLDSIPAKNKKISATPAEECWDCGQQFPNLSRKKKHRKTCLAIGTPDSLRNKNYKCEICNKEINTRSGYRVHLTKIHGNTDASITFSEELQRLRERKRLQCPLCPNRYHQIHQLKYHIRTHQSKLLCVKKNKKSLFPEGKRICPICGKNFERNPFYLETHMKFHRKEKDFQCDQCEKAYFTKHDLRNHKSTVHSSHTLLCGYCGKSFGTRQAFTRHQLIHDDSTNAYHCTFCPKSYPNAGSLKYHVMKHTGEKGSRCELCGHEFRFRYMLTQHLIRNHNIEIEGVKLYKKKKNHRRLTNKTH